MGRKVCLQEHWAPATKAGLKSCWILHGFKETHEMNLLGLHCVGRSNSVLIVSLGSHFSEQKGKSNRGTEILSQLSWADSQKMPMVEGFTFPEITKGPSKEMHVAAFWAV